MDAEREYREQQKQRQDQQMGKSAQGQQLHSHLHPCDSPAGNDCQAATPYQGEQRESLLRRLQREALSYGDQAAVKYRAIELLQMHPEFEDLLELLRIVNIY